jgi:AraC-like DNA-binding protein
MATDARWLAHTVRSKTKGVARASRDGSSEPASGEQQTVPGCLLLQIAQLVKRWNVTPLDLLGGLGLREQDLWVTQARVPLASYIAILERARTLTAEPGLGFCWGLQMRPSAYGYLGFAAMSAATLGEAIELAIEFAPLISTGGGMRLQVEGGIASIVLEEQSDFGGVRDVVVIARLIGLWRIARVITGRELPATADISFPEPRYHARFAHLVAPMRYRQPTTRWVMAADALQTPLVMADPAALRVARDQCERQLDALSSNGRLARTVRHLLWNCDGGLRSPLEVAKALHMSPRTLRRQLALQRSSLSVLLEEERCDRALSLLRMSDLSIEQVSERLGYRNVQNFTRAFRRWTSETPAAYRRSCAVGLIVR